MTQEEELLVEAIQGREIVDGEFTQDGFHLELADGRVVIFSGSFVIAVCRVGELH